MKVLLNEPTYSFVVKRSRFISSARKCESLEKAKELVKETWTLHGDATHVVHAAVVGRSGSLYSSSDDKEPKNTAGRPALEVLKGSGITDICILIVRYFGGTLLGTGGLVQAYGDSAKGVLALAETEELVEKTRFVVQATYQLYEPLKRMLLAQGCTIVDEKFDTSVEIRGIMAKSLCDTVEGLVRELSNAQALCTFTPF